MSATTSKLSMADYANDDFVPASENAVNESRSTSVSTSSTTTRQPLSFGLSKSMANKSRQRLVGNVQLDDDDAPKPEAIKSVTAGGAIVPVVEKKIVPKVVPLLTSNGEVDSGGCDCCCDARFDTNETDALRDAAVNALLAEAKNAGTGTTSLSAADIVVVPMLVKNRLKGLDEVGRQCASRFVTFVLSSQVEGGEDEKFRYDVSRRPEAPTLDSYTNMPVEMIGEAMLRGMGWAPGAGVGKSRVVFEPIDFVKRPGRLGLGSKVDDMLPPTHRDKKYVKQGESREPQAPLGAVNADGTFRSVRRVDEALVPLKRRELVVGGVARVIDGRHAGITARIEAIVGDVFSLRLASDELVSVARTCVALPDDSAATTPSVGMSRDTSRMQLDDDGNGDDAHEPTRDESRSASTASNGHSGRRHDSVLSGEIQSLKRSASTSSVNARVDEPQQSSSSSSLKRRKVGAESLWIVPHIMVRIVSKTFRDGRFYEKKARIVDCVGGDVCVLELDDGRVLEGVTQALIENVVGRVGQRVQVLRGRQRGARGSVLARDAGAQRVQVSLDSNETAEFAFDDVAQLVAE
jgi:G patch domain/KOW motif-containing protein